MKTVEAVKGKWPLVFQHYKLPPVTGKKHYAGECPVCGRKGKFRIDDRDGAGTWICACDNGNGWKLLELATKKDFKTLAKEVDRIIGNEYQPEERPAPKQAPDVSVKDYFLALPKLEGTPAVEYFHNRGIFQLPRKGVRYSAGEQYEKGMMIPCLYAVASNDFGEPIYKHLTFIRDGKKADVIAPRKLYTVLPGFEGSVAVKLRDATSVLGIAEGIETAMSAGFVYRLPCWASINAGFMKKFKAPPGVETLYIFADNDKNGTGLAAAFECGNRNILQKDGPSKVVIRWPKTVNDFNDFITSGDEVLEWVLER